LKILIISQYFWPENFRINDIAKLLIESGVQVSVLTGCPNYPDGKAFKGYRAHNKTLEVHPIGYNIYRVPLILRGNSTSLRLIFNYFSFILSGIIFGPSLIKNENYDLVFVYGLSPILQAFVGVYIKFLRKIPLVTWVQDLWPDSIAITGHIKNQFILSGVSYFVSWIYKNNNLLLVQSKGFINPVKEKAGSTPIVYFPTPGEVNIESSLNESTAHLNFFLKDGFNIIFAGNLGAVQSLPTILGAAELLKAECDIRILFVGSGSQSRWLDNEIKYRKLDNVVLVGRQSPELMSKIFSGGSALLVSLVRDPILNQTIPAKLQSYLAAGKPIIASLDGEGARIVLDAKAGIVCPTENPIALAEAIMKIKMMGQDQRQSMGYSGMEYFASNFEPYKLVSELINIFNQVISEYSKKNES
jgi:glycosyltransferase involved in cell wall biosynthesis